MTIEYNKMSDINKKAAIQKMYELEKQSFGDIAEFLNTYPNKIRRDAIKYNIKIRDKSEAQKNALDTGKHKHPTKGTHRDDSVKQKIGLAVLKSWEELSDEDRSNRKETSRNNWNNLSIDAKENIQHSALVAVRASSKVGSKLEKYLLEKLINSGYKINFHQEQTLVNTRLQIDLFIPNMNIAIEVDGPSHFLPVWGEESLKKNIKYDVKKNGLILGKGLVLIRIKQIRDFSKARSQLIYNKLLELIKQIENKFPSVDNRSFTIEDNNG